MSRQSQPIHEWMPQGAHGPDTGAHGRARRVLAAGAGLIAASAYAGAFGLATGADPYLRHLTDRLPWHSPVFGAAALTLVVAVPHTVAAGYAWRGDHRTDTAAAVAGGLLLGWLAVEWLVLREASFLEPSYAAAGVAMVLTGRRSLPGRTRQRRRGTGTQRTRWG